MLYSISQENAEDPNYAINVFNNGFQVRSQRTARLQSSVDGSTMFNIAYGGDNGGPKNRNKKQEARLLRNKPVYLVPGM